MLSRSQAAFTNNWGMDQPGICVKHKCQCSHFRPSSGHNYLWGHRRRRSPCSGIVFPWCHHMGAPWEGEHKYPGNQPHRCWDHSCRLGRQCRPIACLDIASLWNLRTLVGDPGHRRQCNRPHRASGHSRHLGRRHRFHPDLCMEFQESHRMGCLLVLEDLW